jgi:hypothetical protein
MFDSIGVKLIVMLALVGSIFFGGFKVGSDRKQGQWDAEKVAQLAQLKEADNENRRFENKLAANVIAAQNSSKARERILMDAASAASLESGSLRDAISTITSNLSNASRDALTKYASACGAILNDISGTAERLAKEAQGHSNDSLMYQEAWPRKK